MQDQGCDTHRGQDVLRVLYHEVLGAGARIYGGHDKNGFLSLF